MLRFLRETKFLGADGGNGGGGNTGTQTGGNGGGGNTGTQTIDPNKISESARIEMARNLGFSTIEEMKNFIAASKNPPKNDNAPDVKELQQKLEIYQKQVEDSQEKYKRSTIENALHSALSTLGVTLHSTDDFKKIAMSSLDVDGDQIVIKNATGDIVLNTKGERLSVAEHIQQILTQKPWLIKTNIQSGAGVEPGTRSATSGINLTIEELAKKGQFDLTEFKAAMGRK